MSDNELERRLEYYKEMDRHCRIIAYIGVGLVFIGIVGVFIYKLNIAPI